jgi:hypothetical protein
LAVCNRFADDLGYPRADPWAIYSKRWRPGAIQATDHDTATPRCCCAVAGILAAIAAANKESTQTDRSDRCLFPPCRLPQRRWAADALIARPLTECPSGLPWVPSSVPTQPTRADAELVREGFLSCRWGRHGPTQPTRIQKSPFRSDRRFPRNSSRFLNESFRVRKSSDGFFRPIQRASARQLVGQAATAWLPSSDAGCTALRRLRRKRFAHAARRRPIETDPHPVRHHQ